jgi:lipopolysaccharide cholinephosphotransferase
MEKNQKELVKYKKILNETMKAFIAFCDMHNLQYYACAGSCLGAIRHHGIIPWDDDIDVIMPRESYDRFLSLRSKLAMTNFDILSPEVPGYYLSFAKFINKNTTIVETAEFPFVIGVFVDIFPQDLVGDTTLAKMLMAKKRKAFSKYSLAIEKHSLSTACGLLVKFRIKSFLNYCIYSLFSKSLAKKHFDDFKKLDLEIRNIKGNKCMCYDGFYEFEKEVCEPSWFGDGVEVPFEDYTIKVPKDYHAYLTHMYGDYMTPPPIEKQVSHHYLYFMDLEKHWAINDIMKLNLEKQEKIEYIYE